MNVHGQASAAGGSIAPDIKAAQDGGGTSLDAAPHRGAHFQSHKNNRVEFLRFLFSLSILFFHIQKRFAGDAGVPVGTVGGMDFFFFIHGYIGVEFFFLVSGCLLAASCHHRPANSNKPIGSETAEVMWKKIRYIFPYHLFAMVLTIGVNAYFRRSTLYDRLIYALDSWPSIFMVQVFGFDSTWANKLTWYLDVWLMVTFLFYYFLRKHYDVFIKIVCPLLALFVLGYMSHKYDSLAGVDGWTGHFYKCFLRGLSEMALGCWICGVAEDMKKKRFSLPARYGLGFLEVLGYLLVFFYACRDVDTEYSFLVLFIMAASLILTFSDISPGHRLFHWKGFEVLGSMSLLIYLNQFYSIRLVQYLLPEDSPFPVKTVLCVAATCAGAFACNAVVGLLRLMAPGRRP